MREKFIDSALLAGMVIICVVILYTLFSPPTRNFGRNTTSPQDEVRIDVPSTDEGETSDTTDSEIQSEVPEIASDDSDGAEASDIIPVAPDDGENDGETETQEPLTADTSDTETVDVDTADVETVDVETADDPSSDVEILAPEYTVLEEDTVQEADSVEDSVQEEASAAEAEIDESATSAEVSEAETAEESAVVDGQEADLEPIVPVPAGSFSLERIGFSFVTGGAGACGIVLEAWQHVAVSRDILDRYGCGSQITIQLDDPVDGRQALTAIVADTMNPVNSRTVNIYVGTDEPALEYGVNTGTVEP